MGRPFMVRKLLGTVCTALVLALPPRFASGEMVYFQATEPPGQETHHDSFVLPLTNPGDIAHARQILSLGASNAGATIVNAGMAAGADGINRDSLADDRHLWSRHATRFNGFGDVGIELLDDWPGLVERDVPGWIRNTDGRIGFWNYAVSRELPVASQPKPEPIPAKNMLYPSMAMLGVSIVWLSIRRRALATSI
jgi:hypothetical protein